MKNRLRNRFPVLEVLDHYSLQQLGRDLGIPNPLRVHDDDRPVAAHAEAGRLTTLHALRSKEQIFPLQQLREQGIDLASATIGRAEVAGAHEHMSGVPLHFRLIRITHSEKIHMLTHPSTCTAGNST
jgi:hypothetical protein